MEEQQIIEHADREHRGNGHRTGDGQRVIPLQDHHRDERLPDREHLVPDVKVQPPARALTLSVVIPTRNEEGNIGHVLR